jgi:hypothetical protein
MLVVLKSVHRRTALKPSATVWATEFTRIYFVAGDLEIAFFNALIAKATNFHRHQFRQFPRKIADVNARAAVDVRRIFVGEEKNFHERP